MKKVVDITTGKGYLWLEHILIVGNFEKRIEFILLLKIR